MKQFNHEMHIVCPICKCELLYLDGVKGMCYNIFKNGCIDLESGFDDDAPTMAEHHQVLYNFNRCSFRMDYGHFLWEYDLKCVVRSASPLVEVVDHGMVERTRYQLKPLYGYMIDVAVEIGDPVRRAVLNTGTDADVVRIWELEQGYSMQAHVNTLHWIHPIREIGSFALDSVEGAAQKESHVLVQLHFSSIQDVIVCSELEEAKSNYKAITGVRFEDSDEVDEEFSGTTIISRVL